MKHLFLSLLFSSIGIMGFSKDQNPTSSLKKDAANPKYYCSIYRYTWVTCTNTDAMISAITTIYYDCNTDVIAGLSFSSVPYTEACEGHGVYNGVITSYI